LDGLACRRKTGWVDFNGVHYHRKDSSCDGALTGTEVMEVRDFPTKAKAPDHGKCYQSI